MTQLVIRTARPTPLITLANPFAMIGGLWTHRDLIRQFAARDVQQAHRGTYLGMIWIAAHPLLTLAVYTFVFSYILEHKWSGRLEGTGVHTQFALTFFCGLILYQTFSECANRAPVLLANRRNLVRRVVFPLEILPVTVILARLVYVAVGVVLLVAATLIFAGTVSTTIWLFPFVLVPLLLFTLAVGWFLASVGVYIRDARGVVAVATQLGFFLTPIFYSIEVVPDAYRPVIQLNPLTTIVENGRRTLLWSEMPDWTSLGIVTLISAILLQLSYIWFMRTRRGFADVI